MESLFSAPLPVSDLWEIDTFVVDVLLMLNELVAHLLVEVSAAVAQLGQVFDGFLHQVEAVDFILDADVEWSGDGAFLVVTMNVEVMVVTAIGKLVDEGWIAVEVEDYRLVCGKEHIVLSVCQAVRMLIVRHEFEKVYYIDETNLNVGNFFS